MRAKTSGDLRKQYIENVLGPMPEPQKSMMTESFDSGIAIGIVAASEMMYVTLDEITMNARAIIQRKREKL